MLIEDCSMSKIAPVEGFSSAARVLVGAYSLCIDNSSATCRFDEMAQQLLFEVSHHVALKAPQSCTDDPNDYFEDVGECVDAASFIQATNDVTVHWAVQVMPHPVYSTPCPFIEKMWNNNGHIYSLDEAQLILDSVRDVQLAVTSGGSDPIESAVDMQTIELSTEQQESSTPTSAGRSDHRFYEFGRLTPESHPVTGLPCFSMHICQLQSILQLSEESAHTSNAVGVGTKQTDAVQLLNWCSIVGPHFGVFISPSAYKLMVEKLSI